MHLALVEDENRIKYAKILRPVRPIKSDDNNYTYIVEVLNFSEAAHENEDSFPR